jgi:hypothetical protein
VESAVGEPVPPADLDDLSQAQEDLARALGRARIGEDRALANLVRELGERLAHLLAGLLRMTQLHSPDNTAFNQPVEELHRTLVKLNDTLGSVHLVAVEDQVYVNDIRIRTGEKDTGIHDLGAELLRHNVGGITFHKPLDDAGIRTLVGLLGGEGAPEEPRTALVRALAAAGVTGLELTGRHRFRMAGESGHDLSERHDFIPRALTAIDEAFQNLAAGRIPNPLPLRRLVTELLERDLADEELWEDPKTAPALARHLLRVAHLSLLVGRAAGLAQDVLQDLGVSALYHDCGYAAGGRAEAAEVGFAEHPLAGARLLMHQRGFHEAKTRRVLAALQHHRAANEHPHPGLFGRIIRIAEDYDTLSRRSGKLSPTMALATMLKAAGTLYDPVLLQLLINTLGAYPPGTLLQLEDGRVVRCVTPGPGSERFASPIARCVNLADGTPAPPDQPPVDLRTAGRVRVLRATS